MDNTPELEVRNVLAFLDEMVPVVDSAERSVALLRRKFGIAFRIAEYSVRGQEVPLNRILGDLLDPRGSHGQGSEFLKLFIEMLNDDLPPCDFEKWVVVPSHRTTKGRFVDLALFGPKYVAIYIECKPWADEGCQQLSDYAEDLLKRREEHKRLMFVPGRIREPETLKGDARQRLGAKGFTNCPIQRSGNGCSIVEWLERCASECEAENVRVFIDDLAKYLDAEFCDGERKTAMNDSLIVKMLKDHVRTNKERLKVALSLERATNGLRTEIAQSFFMGLKRELETVLNTAGWIVEFDSDPFNFSDRFQKLWLKKSEWPHGWGIALEMRQTGFKGFSIGFVCPSSPEQIKKYGFSRQSTLNERNLIAAALQELLDAIVGVRKSKLWPAWSFLPPPFRNWDESTFLLLSGLEGQTATETFANWFLNLADAVGNTVDDILRTPRRR